MVIFTLGVNHNDPLGRTDLLARLRTLASSHNNPPAFVAVEYDKHHFRSIASQRNRFRSMIKTECDALSTADLDTYTKSLAYDGDSHHEVFPDVPVVWLDQGRELSGTELQDLENYATLQLKKFLHYSSRDLRRMEKLSCAFKVAEWPNTSTQTWTNRNKTFADRIYDCIREIKGSWAIAITGKAHACNSLSGSMRQLLEAAGVNCVKG